MVKMREVIFRSFSECVQKLYVPHANVHEIVRSLPCSLFLCHSRESGNPFIDPHFRGGDGGGDPVPAYAGTSPRFHRGKLSRGQAQEGSESGSDPHCHGGRLMRGTTRQG